MISEVIQAIQDAVTGFGDTIVSAVKTLFNGFMFDTNGTTQTLSNVAKFGFLLLGISLVMGLSYWVINLIRRKI